VTQLCLAEVRIIVKLGKQQTAEGLKHRVCIGGKHRVCMGHGVSSAGTERGDEETRDSIAVEWGGAGDRSEKYSRQKAQRTIH
jgi:hypothetical protein